MLEPLSKQLSSLRIILASESPRRQSLIKNIGLKCECVPSLFEENLNPNDFPTIRDFVEETALQKVLEVSKRLCSNSSEKRPDIIIGADTIVTLNNKIYGKPKTSEKAFEMLKELVGKPHTVFTSVVLMHNEKIRKFTESTTVYFGKATDAQIKAYVETGEPLDKAGGYGIQGYGGTFVEKIEGDYFTVIGLPLYKLCNEICQIFKYEIN